MVAEEKSLVCVTDWHGCYGEGWGADLVPEAFAHPAKYSRALVRRIYEHAFAEGWLRVGSRVVDPFGGIAGGAFDAMLRGCHWTGGELEGKFVTLGQQNIDLWNGYYSQRVPQWGTARLIQGDSRKLSEVIRGAELAISSPPYAGNYKSDRTAEARQKRSGFRQGAGCFRSSESYGTTPGQLGGMSEGSFDLAISSPPFNENKNNQITGSTKGVRGGTAKERLKKDYLAPEHPANVGALSITSEGFDLAISSPPFQDSLDRGVVDKDARVQWAREHGISNAAEVTPADVEHLRKQEYGKTEGQLGAMKPGDFDVAISSPPYEASLSSEKSGIDFSKCKKDYPGRVYHAERIAGHQRHHNERRYSGTKENLGNNRGEDFWSASRLILEQLYEVLAPDGHAIFVTKNFVRNKRIVPFSQQWAQLAEAVGFRLVHHHRAWLVEHHGTQGGMFGEDTTISTERKSFFRRLSEQKGSPRIDWEDVMCFEK